MTQEELKIEIYKMMEAFHMNDFQDWQIQLNQLVDTMFYSIENAPTKSDLMAICKNYHETPLDEAIDMVMGEIEETYPIDYEDPTPQAIQDLEEDDWDLDKVDGEQEWFTRGEDCNGFGFRIKMNGESIGMFLAYHKSHDMQFKFGEWYNITKPELDLILKGLDK